MAFPDTPLDIITELFIDGAWVDVSGDVYNRDPIHITRGRADESSSVDPSSCTLTLNNRGGKYSPRNPNSPYYGKIGRNTPIRVSVAQGDPYLEIPPEGGKLSLVSTPVTPAMQMTGDIDVRVDLGWAQTDLGNVVSQSDHATNTGWYLTAGSGSGDFHFTWYDETYGWIFYAPEFDLVANNVPERSCFRFVFEATPEVSYGGALYWGPTIDGPWSLGATAGSGAEYHVSPSDAPMSIGGSPDIGEAAFSGPIHRVQIRDGINGAIVVDSDFSKVPVGASSYTDLAGNPFTVTEPAGVTTAISTRFFGEVSAWPVSWSASGADSWVSVEAAGITRRLGQGSKPTESDMRRTVMGYDGLIAYWPMEDIPKNADQKVFSPLTNTGEMRTAGFNFSAASDMLGSAPLPTVDEGGVLRAEVPAFASDRWSVQFVFKTDSAPTSERTVLWVPTVGGDSSRGILLVKLDSDRISLVAADENGDNGFTIDYSLVDPLGYDGWRAVELTAETVGATSSYEMFFSDIGSDAAYYASGSGFSGTPGVPTEIRATMEGLGGIAIGHISVYTADFVNTSDVGRVGEAAGNRVERLVGYENIPFTIIGDAGDTARLGSQKQGTFLDIIQEAADADFGLVYESSDALGMLYRTRTSVYNQPTALVLDYEAGDIATLDPVDGDASIRNDVTVTRSDGGFDREILTDGRLSVAPPPAGVGLYNEELELNLWDSSQCPDHAMWRLHEGTWDESRYPTVDINLARSPHLTRALATVGLLDRVTVKNPPGWLPPGDIDLLVQGYSETLSLTGWDVTLNCTPYGPWDVAELGSEIADTSNSTVSAAGDTDTTLTVTGDLWTTEPTDFPLSVDVNGELITVTAVSGETSPQNFTVTRSVNGVVKPISAGSELRLANPSTVAL